MKKMMVDLIQNIIKWNERETKIKYLTKQSPGYLVLYSYAFFQFCDLFLMYKYIKWSMIRFILKKIIYIIHLIPFILIYFLLFHSLLKVWHIHTSYSKMQWHLLNKIYIIHRNTTWLDQYEIHGAVILCQLQVQVWI